jgi:hypothetical protein
MYRFKDRPTLESWRNFTTAEKREFFRAIIADLITLGVMLTAVGDELCITDPQHELSPREREILIMWKNFLIPELAAYTTNANGHPHRSEDD